MSPNRGWRDVGNFQPLASSSGLSAITAETPTTVRAEMTLARHRRFTTPALAVVAGAREVVESVRF
jgi:hypothetical protein